MGVIKQEVCEDNSNDNKDRASPKESSTIVDGDEPDSQEDDNTKRSSAIGESSINLTLDRDQLRAFCKGFQVRLQFDNHVPAWYRILASLNRATQLLSKSSLVHECQDVEYAF